MAINLTGICDFLFPALLQASRLFMAFGLMISRLLLEKKWRAKWIGK